MPTKITVTNLERITLRNWNICSASDFKTVMKHFSYASSEKTESFELLVVSFFKRLLISQTYNHHNCNWFDFDVLFKDKGSSPCRLFYSEPDRMISHKNNQSGSEWRHCIECECKVLETKVAVVISLRIRGSSVYYDVTGVVFSLILFALMS